MHCIYIIKSIKYNWFYVGSTSNLKQRLSQHNSGLVQSTKYRKPYKLVHCEKFSSISDARKRERELKKSRSKKEDILKNIKDGPIV